MKTCSGCKKTKARAEFSRCASRSDGLQGRCKECRKAMLRQHRKARPDLRRGQEARSREAHPDRHSERSKRWRAANPAKAAAQDRVAYALRTGQLIRPDACEDCGEPGRPGSDGRSGIEAHHTDYDKPLEVEWLCHGCHAAADRERVAA